MNFNDPVNSIIFLLSLGILSNYTTMIIMCISVYKDKYDSEYAAFIGWAVFLTFSYLVIFLTMNILVGFTCDLVGTYLNQISDLDDVKALDFETLNNQQPLIVESEDKKEFKKLDARKFFETYE